MRLYFANVAGDTALGRYLVDLPGHDITGAGFYSHYAFKSDPPVFVDDVVEVGYDRAGSCLLPSMGLPLHGVIRRWPNICKRTAYPVGHFRLIPFQRKDIIGSTLYYRPCNLFLTAHGIDCDYAVFQFEYAEKSGYGFNLVALSYNLFLRGQQVVRPVCVPREGHLWTRKNLWESWCLPYRINGCQPIYIGQQPLS